MSDHIPVADILPARPAQYWQPTTPVHYDETLSAWNVYSYADVQRVIYDEDGFSADYRIPPELRREVNPILAGLFGSDGARHRDLRKIVAEPFRPSVLARLEVDVRAIVNALIDELTPDSDGCIEAVTALAKPLPAQVICRLMGVDVDISIQIRHWMDEIAAAGTANAIPRQEDLSAYFQQLIEQRRAQPAQGLIDDLIDGQRAGHTIEGQPLTDWDLITYVTSFLGAGTDTTAAALTNALFFLVEYGHWPLLAKQPRLIPNAVEETLRWYPAFPAVRRRARLDIEMGGQRINTDDWVLAWITAANRDPARFDTPDRFDIRRQPNRHLTLGTGRHYCIGAPLAKLEMRILIEEASRRLPGLRRDRSRPLQRRYGLVDPLIELRLYETGTVG
jgi:cytochrome P450